MPSVVIVGAGLSGMSLAYRLRRLRPDVDITILEKNARAGGNVWTETLDGFQIEWGPNGFLDSKPSTLQLCRDLGLSSQLRAASEVSRKNRYLYWNDKLRPLPNSLWSFVASDLLSWRGKLNLILERYRRRPLSVKSDESVAAFAERRAGKEVASLFADAIVTGIHAGDPALLSVNSAFPRVAQFEREFGSVTRGFSHAAKSRRAEEAARGDAKAAPGRMWSLHGGLRVLVEALRDQCQAPIISGVSVKRVRREGPKWVVRADGAESWTADVVVLACPAREQAAQVADLDSALSESMAAIPYSRVAVIALGYRQADIPRALDGFGYIAPQATRRDVLGVQWCSSIFPDRAPDGMVLWRALCGGWNRTEIVDWDDARLIEAVRQELHVAMGVSAEPLLARIVRWPLAIPQYTLGHLDRVALIEERLKFHPGLLVAGNAYHGVAMNDCTEQAVKLAARVAERLNNKLASA
jgi:protoporphyrinogen/coproporphyrinogen III oxidase